MALNGLALGFTYSLYSKESDGRFRRSLSGNIACLSLIVGDWTKSSGKGVCNLKLI